MIFLTLTFTLALAAGDSDLDTTFGDGGSYFLNLGSDQEGVVDLVVQPDGKVVGVGRSAGDIVLIRLTEEGSLDSSFGSDGIVVQSLPTDAGVSALARQSDGKLIVVGDLGGDILVVRFNTDGSLDTTGFNNPDGYVTLDLGHSEIGF